VSGCVSGSDVYLSSASSSGLTAVEIIAIIVGCVVVVAVVCCVLGTTVDCVLHIYRSVKPRSRRTELDQSINQSINLLLYNSSNGGSVAEWLACWTQKALKGSGSNRSLDAVG